MTQDFNSRSRVPVGRIFPRRSSSSSSNQPKYCELCGRQLVYFKPASTWLCWECNWSPPEFVEQQQQEPRRPKEDSIIPSLDGSLDSQQQRRKPFIKSAGDPRAKLLKRQQQPEYDSETEEYIKTTGAVLKDYHEHIPDSGGEVLSREELRARKEEGRI